MGLIFQHGSQLLKELCVNVVVHKIVHENVILSECALNVHVLHNFVCLDIS